MNKEYEIFNTSNDIPVIYTQLKDSNLTAIQICVKVGSIDETPDLSGASHYLEHMLFKGTKKRDKTKDIFTEIFNKGGYINAFTSKNSTCYVVQLNSNYAETAIDILSDMLLNSTLDNDEFEMEKAVVIEEINQSNDEPQRFLLVKLYETIFQNNRLAQSIAGTEDIINSFKRDKIMKYYKKYYVSNNMAIAISSNLPKQKIKSIIEKSDFPKFKPNKNITRKEVVALNQQTPRYSINTKNLQQIHLTIGFPVCDMYNNDRFGVDLLACILGGNMNSRLFMDLREKNGLSYQIDVASNYYEKNGEIIIYTSFDKDSLFTVNEMDKSIDNHIDAIFQDTQNDNSKRPGGLPIILNNLKDLKEQLISDTELQNNVGYLTGNTDIATEDTKNVVGYYGEQLLFKQKICSLKQLKKKYSSITKEQLQKIANKYFDFTKLNIAILGNIDKSELKKFIESQYL